MSKDLKDTIEESKERGFFKGLMEDNDPDSDDSNGQLQKLKGIRFQANTNHRKGLILWTCIIVSTWLAAVLAILFLIGFKKEFELDANIVITLLATTTLNVLGLSLIVLKGIFTGAE